MSVVLQCEHLRDRRQAHPYLVWALSLPAHYGNNLDALFDCLTEMGKTDITLRHHHLLLQGDAFGRALLRVIQQAAAANPNLHLTLE